MAVASDDGYQRFTYRDYRSWPEDERRELIEGVAWDMNPSPSTSHQQILMALFNIIYNFLREKSCQVFIAPLDVRFPEDNEPDGEIESVVQPDLFIVCDRTKMDDHGCKGAPDVIMEVLSPYTARKDMKEKLSLYEKVGVREYWLIQPNDKTVMVYMRGKNGKYGRPAIYTEEDEVKIGILALRIDMEQVFQSQ